MSKAEAFFVPDGDGFVASELTRGPWSRDHQHGGPPVALLGRAIARRAGAERPDLHIARFTVEFLRPMPIGRASIEADVVRAGRKSMALAASLRIDGRDVARATALALRTTSLDLPPLPEEVAPPPPEQSAPFSFPFFCDPIGYHSAMEIRIARGAFGSGALTGWLRMRHPLVAGEPPSPLERVLVAADAGNGLSAALDTERYSFMNPDLNVNLLRLPEGEWVCLDAVTTVLPSGVGLADSRLYDVRGPIGRVVQCLLIEELPA